jgi:oligopeptide transport system permease protein
MKGVTPTSSHAVDARYLEPDESVAPPESWLALSCRRFRRNRAAMISLGLFVVICAVAIFAPFLTPYNPMNVAMSGPVPTGLGQGYDSGPTAAHLLGTDSLGRDVFARVVYGLRLPLVIAIPGALMCTVIGTLVGLLSGYHGGWIDELLVRITEIIFVIPGLLLIILCITLYGHALDQYLGIYGAIAMITLFTATDNWPVMMRITRGEALHLREMEFVDAARVAGTSSWQIVRRHLLPNILGIVLVQGSLMVGGFAFVTVLLGFFSIGIPPDLPDVGSMLSSGMEYFTLNVWELVAPAVLVTALVTLPTFVGDGLRDAFDVRSK